MIENNDYSMLKLKELEEDALKGRWLRGCAVEVEPLVKEAFRKLKELDIDWESTAAGDVLEIGTLIANVARNTQKGENIPSYGVEALKEIFRKIDALCQETLEIDRIFAPECVEFREKLVNLNVLVCVNFQDMTGPGDDAKVSTEGKIFQEYDNLLIALENLNDNWLGLQVKSRISTAISQFHNKVKSKDESEEAKPSETQKMQMFLSILKEV